jgi:TetR/AcrR family tetracycline transcriptional repressor
MAAVARIDREQIVEAALQLLDEHGLAGVTTRKIADRLGVKSASLYWHVRNRDELLDLLADRVVADARWPEPSLSWRTQVESLMGEYLRCLLAHRDAAQLSAGRPPRGPRRLRGAETMLSALLAAGLSAQQAIDATLVLTTYVVGFALEHDAAAAQPSGAASGAPRDHYPTLERLAPLLQPPGPVNRFEAGLAVILDGIEAQQKCC